MSFFAKTIYGLFQVGGYMVPTLTVGLMIIASAVFILILFWNVEFKGKFE